MKQIIFNDWGFARNGKKLHAIWLCNNKVVHLHKITIMAITIKNIPVLEGATAEDFVRSADKNATKATPVCRLQPRNGCRKSWRNPVHSVSTKKLF